MSAPNTLTGNIKLDTGISCISAVIAWIGIKEAQTALAITASCVAILSGLLASYHYILQIAKRRKDIQKENL